MHLSRHLAHPSLTVRITQAHSSSSTQGPRHETHIVTCCRHTQPSSAMLPTTITAIDPYHRYQPLRPHAHIYLLQRLKATLPSHASVAASSAAFVMDFPSPLPMSLAFKNNFLAVLWIRIQSTY